MNFEIPKALTAYIAEIDCFVKNKILPLQHTDDNNRFFDHRREHSRTDWIHNGNPKPEWEDLLSKC